MKPCVFLPLLVAVCFSTVTLVSGQPQYRNLLQFRKIIKCIIPDSRPLNEYNGYGCYCGFGGSGTPVDELDKCCQIHDECYGQYKSIKNCNIIFDNPYTEFYSYSCNDNTVTCNSNNNACEMHICECDKQAALCFSQASYNELHKNLEKDQYCL
ncbi:phospholipase A2, minor isoenzyme-like isoform X1 [Engystomops pustulosus]|uniref:phospholipase A2, minor isoenzyme-like isoform X1 n=1 Tax=Engystomops pustulosus TaxID=76066 RepID=UPI003AFA0CB3